MTEFKLDNINQIGTAVSARYTRPKVNSTWANDSISLELNEGEKAELILLGEKILNRFAADIIFNNQRVEVAPKIEENLALGRVPEITEGHFPTNPAEVKKEEPVKLKTRAKKKEIEKVEEQKVEPVDAVITEEAELPNPVKTKATIEDLRHAVQEFFVKNGNDQKAMDAQKAKLVPLFELYGSSNVTTFPKNKIGELLEKLKTL